MLFKKLPIVFLSTIIAEESSSANGHIAAFILEHLDMVKQMHIHALAEHCHVSKSSISRFCHYIGLEDFGELKEVLNTAQLDYHLYAQSDVPAQRANVYLRHIADSLALAEKTVDYRGIARLCKDIKAYRKVAAFGLLKAETAAITLQSDLLMMGKVIHTQVQFKRQLDYLKQATSDDLIILFSYTGVYFDYTHERLQQQLQDPKVYFITSNQEMQCNGAINEIIRFDSKQNQASHPYQLQYIAGIIAQEYGYLVSRQNPECT